MWNVGLRARVGLDDLSPEALQQHDLQRIRGWHPDVRLLVGAGDPAAAGLLRAVGHSERVMVEQAFAVSDAGPATDRR